MSVIVKEYLKIHHADDPSLNLKFLQILWTPVTSANNLAFLNFNIQRLAFFSLRLKITWKPPRSLQGMFHIDFWAIQSCLKYTTAFGTIQTAWAWVDIHYDSWQGFERVTRVSKMNFFHEHGVSNNYLMEYPKAYSPPQMKIYVKFPIPKICPHTLPKI